MTRSLLRHGAGVLMAAALATGVAAHTALADDGQIQRQSATIAYSEPEADAIARRLYRAILDREPDPGGLAATIHAIRVGAIDGRVREMVESSEYQNRIATRPPRDILAQFYQGLLGRSPDPAGFDAWLNLVQNRQYVEVIRGIVESPEFQSQLGRAPTSRRGAFTRPGSFSSRPRTPVECMEQVVERVRTELGGAVLLRFSSTAMQGVAIDVLDGRRLLNYDCNNGVSYSYQDNRRLRSAPAESEFADGQVQACHEAVRAQYTRERNRGIGFESAGVMRVDGDVVIRGAAYERPEGLTFDYECEVGSFVSARYRLR